MRWRRGVHASGVSPVVQWHPVCLGVVLLTRSLAAPSSLPVDESLVLTQVPRQTRLSPVDRKAGRWVRNDWFAGARVVVRSPDGSLRVLSSGLHSAADPNVSFDGQRILFAGKKDAGSRWRIWEIGADGQGLRAVSPEHLEARSPIHAATLFTLDSPQPWFTTVFVGFATTPNEQGRTGISSLYNIRLDGTELRRLTFNPNHNLDPFQMWDGRIIYSAEHYPNQPALGTGRVGLYAIHVEGADMEFYGGERGGPYQHMACATERGLVVFVEPDPANQDGAGQLACVDERRPHVTYRVLSQDRSHAFLYPSPRQANRLLVSRRSANGKGTCAVFAFDADSARCEPVFDSPDFHDVQAVVLRPRPRPDGHSTVVDTKFNSGLLYGLNAYDADARMAPYFSTGMIQRVRFIEGVLATNTGPVPLPAVGGPFIARRLVGEAPVEADGSFNVEVPADTPLLLQTLDERGLALATCGWIWVKPKEKRGCIGCHEDPERIPENHYVLALRRPSNQLVLPPSARRTVSFRQDIAPILQRHCATADCHGGRDTPLHLPLATERPAERDLDAAYAALMAPARGRGKSPAAWPQPGRYVDAGRARTSWLIWQLKGQDTSRPWDQDREGSGAEPRGVKRMPPDNHGEPLSAEELRTVIQWIDLGAPFNAPAAVPEPGKTP